MNATQEPFVWGQGGAESQRDRAKRVRQIAEQLLNRSKERAGGIDTSPVGHWTQGAARVVEALGGVLQRRRDAKEAKDYMAQAANMERDGEARAQTAMNPVLSSFGGGTRQFPQAPVSEAQPNNAAVERAPLQSVDDNAKRIYEGLVARGLPEHVAVGALGNNKIESRLDPGINELNPLVKGSRGGFGINQWTGPRRREFEAFAAQQGKPLDDLDVQLDFTMKELQGSERGAMQKLMQTKTPEEAAQVYSQAFLRPGIPHLEKRIAAAQQYSSLMGNQSQSSGQDAITSALMQRQQPQQAPNSQTPQSLPMMAGGQETSYERFLGLDTPGNTMPAAPKMDAGMLMQALQEPNLNDGQRSMLNGLLDQEMQKQDPAYQLQQQNAQIGLQKNQLELQQMQNPDPVEQQMKQLQLQKLQAETAQIGQPKEAPKPSAIQEYEYAKGQGFAGTFQDWEASKKGGMSLQTNADGTVTFQQGGNMKPLTEGQSKDVVFSTRAKGALEKFNPIAGELTNLGSNLSESIPMGMGSGAQSENFQVARTAGNEFLQAILRKDTGAAITADEQALYGETYLPKPGDSVARLKYKEEARNRAVAAIDAGMPAAAMIAQENALQASGGQELPRQTPPTQKRLKFNPATGELE